MTLSDYLLLRLQWGAILFGVTLAVLALAWVSVRIWRDK